MNIIAPPDDNAHVHAPEFSDLGINSRQLARTSIIKFLS